MLFVLAMEPCWNKSVMTLNAPNAETLKDEKSLQITVKNHFKEENKMKVNVLKKSETELKIEIEGSSHGLCNLIQKRLLEDSRVDFAGYDVPHPLASSPIIYLRMKADNNPADALVDAVAKIREANAAFGKELDRVLKA